ncbi:MAG TPA: sodium:proton exchanger [Candidatus Magasanikbacteria bacterium]|uniref:Na+/Ca+ antiporter, CaCA family n=1 Tax=Candidatus Magasanikbacteria bacterium GW2011_GWE2_42_7 TaxID=1619052 RepID=A0A0G1BG41_9BACT|nr:MAG: Na+/Ca+ antiporter, CaCA family [Candidatus Magasanikbacteria bacterium GW2011_GWC2_42_27]KKS72144.1 MAG: Na+/Ca+ antiporter, CaCA family [Candidatus Magasanikbacteria bacterium GW2011_GWE2_42_7]KKT25925.1 MAG: Na+/Ca+ antiporter, CaCA family [Candidatus Magasanikbacteria bacterium GW2011_GWA2_43_9]HBB37901.1 sodium:proton exchanger [Candidatus Magasanikbacteria bacterium]HCC13429.1 sodium:proton exchanger [Candidatus Magasanikbacteria bacterium]
MLIPILFLLLGLGILIIGGDALVRGSASIAKKLGVKPIVIGLTIVAFGTSAPELIVNLFSAVQGNTDLAVGNVIGSNIANILLILGVAACIFPLRVQRATTWKEIPFALLAAGLVFIMGNDLLIDGMSFNTLSRSEGLVLIAFFAIFLYYTAVLAKSESNAEETNGIKLYSLATSISFTIAGIIALFLGGKLLVDNAVILAKLAGLSEALIGFTIVAIGTSLPELVTSVIAAMKKQDDLAVGNIVGSNIFNIFWILGLTSTIVPIPFNTAMNLDLMVNIGATVLLFLFMFVHSRHRINRWQGVTFLLLYVGYLALAISRG